MKTIAIGEMSVTGGFNGKCQEVKETGEPLLVMKKNQPFVIIYPMDDSQLAIHRASGAFVKILGVMTDIDSVTDTDVLVQLHSQVLLGIQAEAILTARYGYNIIQSAKKEVFEAVSKIVAQYENNHKEEASSAGEQLVAPYDEEEGMPVVSPTLLKAKGNQTSSRKRKTPPRSGVRKMK